MPAPSYFDRQIFESQKIQGRAQIFSLILTSAISIWPAKSEKLGYAPGSRSKKFSPAAICSGIGNNRQKLLRRMWCANIPLLFPIKFRQLPYIKNSWLLAWKKGKLFDSNVILNSVHILPLRFNNWKFIAQVRVEEW